jgi:hypothetical protein
MVVALYFDTAVEAPFVIKNEKGGFPEYVVPWRTGTDLRAASRANLLSVLVPIRRLSSLKNEVSFNRTMASGSFGYVFRNQEFYKALEDGVLETIQHDIGDKIKSSYMKIELKPKNPWLSSIFRKLERALRLRRRS